MYKRMLVLELNFVIVKIEGDDWWGVMSSMTSEVNVVMTDETAVSQALIFKN